MFKDTPGRRGAHQVPGDAAGRRGVGGARRLRHAQQERAAEHVSGRHHAQGGPDAGDLARSPASTSRTSQPAAFGATVGQGEFKIFQDFLKNPSNVNGIAAAARESAAAKPTSDRSRRHRGEPVAAAPPGEPGPGAALRDRGRVPGAGASSCSACGSSTRPSTRSSAACSGVGVRRLRRHSTTTRTLFSDGNLRQAIKNNALWVAVIPALVTSIGLVFAVLIERIRWSVAFRLAVFMPMAISLFAAGVIWRIQYQQDPSQGAINAAIASVKNAVSPPGVLSTASPSTKALSGSPQTTGLAAQVAGEEGQRRPARRDGDQHHRDPEDVASRRVKPQPAANGITGVVWRDFKPGGGKPGVVEQSEAGLPGVTVELRDSSGTRRGDGEDRRRRRLHVPERRLGQLPRRHRRVDVREAVRRRRLARPQADHAGAS